MRDSDIVILYCHTLKRNAQGEAVEDRFFFTHPSTISILEHTRRRPPPGLRAYFYWKSILLGEIFDLLSKMSSKTWLYRWYVVQLSVSLSFTSRFQLYFRQWIQDITTKTCSSLKIVYTWKMRKSKPDWKYFGEMLENENFLVKIHKNHPKTVQIIFLRNWLIIIIKAFRRGGPHKF